MFAPGTGTRFALYRTGRIVEGLVGSWEVDDVEAEVAF
jgi:hypothetical protein